MAYKFTVSWHVKVHKVVLNNKYSEQLSFSAYPRV